MITDAELLFSDSQALTATAISTNVYDSAPLATGNNGIDLGSGCPVYGVVHCETAMAGTSPTLAITFESSAAAALTSANTHYTHATLTALAAGTLIKFVLPPANTWLRYSGFRYTLGGTSPTVTLTSILTLDPAVLRIDTESP